MGSIETGDFKVGIARSCIEINGGRGLFNRTDFDALGQISGLTYEFVEESGPIITPHQTARYDAIFALQPSITPDSFQGNTRLKFLCLSGAGFDTVDIDACGRAGVMVANTPDAVGKPVALAILTFILALSHRLMMKDRLTRTGRWNERINYMGDGLAGKVVGSIGFGNIARESFRLLRPLEMVLIANSPRGDPAIAAAEGVRLVDFETVMRESDFLCINCPLKPDTRHLIDAKALAMMKPSAYLINTSRGPVVDERALYTALASNRIAGAALDVFDQEPTPSDNPLFTLDNVIVTPHALCWTDACFQGIADKAIEAIVAVGQGRLPDHLLNPAVLNHPRQVR